jgi:Tol biopolymer transport system component
VFSSDREGEFDLWSRPLSDNGSREGPRRLTRHAGNTGQCAISRDGRRVAYEQLHDGQGDIWIVSVLGGPATRFTHHPARDMHPAWSPDGDRVAFVSDREGSRHVWVARFDGVRRTGDPICITSGDGVDSVPVWSKDGESIAFMRLLDGQRDVWTVHPDGSGGARRLTVGADARYIDWDAGEESLWVAATWQTDSIEVRRLDIDDGANMPFSPPLILGPASEVAYFDVDHGGDRLAYVEREVVGDIWTLKVDKERF